MGFTMVEIIIVVMISSIMLAIAAPSISESLASVRLGTTARTFAADLRRARVEALRRNVSITVRTQTGGAYVIDSIGSRNLDDDVVFSASSGDSVRFASFGLSLTGAVTFYLSVGSDSASVVVSAAGLTTVVLP